MKKYHGIHIQSTTLNSFLSVAYQIALTFLTFCFVVSLPKLHALLYILCAVNTNMLIFCCVIYRDIICVLIRKPQNLYMLTHWKIHTKTIGFCFFFVFLLCKNRGMMAEKEVDTKEGRWQAEKEDDSRDGGRWQHSFRVGFSEIIIY